MFMYNSSYKTKQVLTITQILHVADAKVHKYDRYFGADSFRKWLLASLVATRGMDTS